MKGVGPSYDKQLASVGIHTAEDLLQKGKTSQGRTEISEKSKISEKLILKWTNSIDLLRIKGIEAEISELFKDSDVETMDKLAKKDPKRLFQKMVQINNEKNILKNSLTLRKVENWISQAKALPKSVEHPVEEEKRTVKNKKDPIGKASGAEDHLKIFLYRVKEKRNLASKIEDKNLVRGNYQRVFDPGLDLSYLKRLEE